MTLYTVALLVRTVADGLGAVPDHVQQAATAMGYTRVKRFFAIELPLAVPVISAGLRVAAVSNVSIVSVGTIIGDPPARAVLQRRVQPRLLRPARRRHRRPASCWRCSSTLVIIVLTRLFTPWLRATGGRA